MPNLHTVGALKCDIQGAGACIQELSCWFSCFHRFRRADLLLLKALQQYKNILKGKSIDHFVIVVFLKYCSVTYKGWTVLER